MATNETAGRQQQSALRLLDHTVEGLARRQSQRLYLRYLTDALFWGLLFAAVTVFLLRFVRQPHSVLLVTVSLIIAALLISLFLASRRVPDKLAVAIVADEKLDFKQRLSTAWEYRQWQPESELTSALALQAGGARLPSVSSVFPFEMNLWGMLVPLAVCLLVLASLVDLKTPDNSSVLLQVDQLVVEEGARLEAYARRMQQRAGQEGLKRSLGESVELKQLGETMKSGALSRRLALHRLQRLERSITTQRSAALGESAAAEGQYHRDRPSSGGTNDSLSESLRGSQASGIESIRHRVSSGRLSPKDLEALNRSLEALDSSSFSRDELKNAMDNYSRGESGDLQRILDSLSGEESGIRDAEELDRARAVILRSRENLGEDTGADQGASVSSESVAFGIGDEAGDTSNYTLSEFPGDATGGGSGMSQDTASFSIPDNGEDQGGSTSRDTQVTLKPEARFQPGKSFRSETWTLPENNAANLDEVPLDTQFESQLEAVLSRESYPLHRKEFVRRYFLNLSNGVGRASPNEEDQMQPETASTGDSGQ